MPFGRYKYKCLPMSEKGGLDFAQHIMDEVLQGLDSVEVYLDHISPFRKAWEDIFLLYDKGLSCLEANGYTVNPFKCELSKKQIGLGIV